MLDPLAGKGVPAKRGGKRLTARDRDEFAPVDVHQIRWRFRMTQREFAQMIGISPETLRNWERGRRYPLGPARALLRIAGAADPEEVAFVLLRERREFDDDAYPPEQRGVVAGSGPAVPKWPRRRGRPGSRRRPRAR